MTATTFEAGSAFWDGRMAKPATFNQDSDAGTVSAYLREMARRREELKRMTRSMGRTQTVPSQLKSPSINSVA